MAQDSCGCAPCCSPAVRGQGGDKRRAWSDEKWGSESVTLTPIFLLSEGPAQMRENQPMPG
jgi:hypothetical protein